MSPRHTNKNRNIRRVIIYLLIDLLIITASFFVFIWIKPASQRIYLPRFWNPFLFFTGVWLFVSLLISKYKLDKAFKFKDIYIPVLIANFTIVAVITTMMFSFGIFGYSRLIIFGTIILTTIIELLLGYLFFSIKRPLIIPEFDASKVKKPKYYSTDKEFEIEKADEARFVETREQIKNIIVTESSTAVFQFISKYVDVGNPKNLTLSTTTQFNIDQLPQNRFSSLVNLHGVNDIRRLNKFFEAVNNKLPDGGLFLGNAETYVMRKARILKDFPPVLNYIYYFFDFIFTRIFPKLPVLKKIYFFVTLGHNRVLSRAETLGRLYSCGFECVEEQFIDDKLYFVMRKISEPKFDENPTYGLFIRLNRYGKNGKIIGVYKMRTMHAYSEYLQAYIYQMNQLEVGGKFKDDFRVTAAGKFMRKFWLDELPMIFNLLKGDMKLVGVRPLSKQYFNLYTKEFQKKRNRFKPGLVPPFYVDMPKTLPEIMASEDKYLDAYSRNPITTDFKYFFAAFYNIIFKKARSN